LGQPYTLRGQLLEIGLDEPGLEDDGARPDAHASGAVMLEALHRRHRQGLDAFGILGTARDVDL